MSEAFRKLLVSEEEVVMSDAANISGSWGKLVLTNKRLFFCGVKGLFNHELVIKREVSLNDIADVHGDVGKPRIFGVIDNSWLVVKPKVGDEWRCGFSFAGWHPLEGTLPAREQSIAQVVDWTISIKNELLKIAEAR